MSEYWMPIGVLHEVTEFKKVQGYKGFKLKDDYDKALQNCNQQAYWQIVRPSQFDLDQLDKGHYAYAVFTSKDDAFQFKLRVGGGEVVHVDNLKASHQYIVDVDFHPESHKQLQEFCGEHFLQNDWTSFYIADSNISRWSFRHKQDAVYFRTKSECLKI